VKQQTLFGATSLSETNSTRAPAGDAKQQHDAGVDPAVHPVLNLAVPETCAYCGHEIGAGCIIPDFEELGSFCCQECADWRFRIYLENEA
jgi:hypothetical protein